MHLKGDPEDVVQLVKFLPPFIKVWVWFLVLRKPNTGLGDTWGKKGKGPTKQTMFESAIIKQNNLYANWKQLSFKILFSFLKLKKYHQLPLLEKNRLAV